MEEGQQSRVEVEDQKVDIQGQKLRSRVKLCGQRFNVDSRVKKLRVEIWVILV